MSQVKLAAARELIRENYYFEARVLLETMPDDPTAKAWLKKLRKTRRGCAPVVVAFILGVMLTGLAQTAAARIERVTPAVTAAASATRERTRIAPTPMPTFAPVVFSGSTGLVVGPIRLPAGMYRARVVTDGFFIAHIQVSDGECGTNFYMTPSLFNLSSGRANGAEAIINSVGCTAYIETSNITTGWTLEITDIR